LLQKLYRGANPKEAKVVRPKDKNKDQLVLDQKLRDKIELEKQKYDFKVIKTKLTQNESVYLMPH
jgi:hypothetical protein